MERTPKNRVDVKFSLDIKQLTLEQVDAQMAKSSKDPVMTRLWDAARMKLLSQRNEGEPGKQIVTARPTEGHTDGHTDRHIDDW